MMYFFYGEECPHCHNVMPVVDKLIAEGKEIQKLETWHNDENAKILSTKDDGLCGGVPFFFNEETGASICGETNEEKIREWAQAK